MVNHISFLKLLICLLPFSSFSQEKFNICFQFEPPISNIKGRVIILYSNSKNQEFSLKRDSCFWVYLNERNFRIAAQFENYEAYNSSFNLDTLNGKLLINIRKKTIVLEEIIIKPEDRIVRNGDTLIIKTDGIKLKPQGSASDLLNRIPGISISSTGQISVLGKQVDEITVNGKSIFGGNGKATLESLKGDMIQQLEIVDSPDGSMGNKSLNLRLKKNKTDGIYGNQEINIGTENTFSSSLRLNQITPKKFQNGFINSNNINEKVISPQDEFRMITSIFNGIGGSYSITEFADNKFIKNFDRRFDNIPVIDTKEGINKTISGGYNYSFSTQKCEIFGFLLTDYTTQKLLYKSKSNLSFNNFRQTDVENSSLSTVNSSVWSNVQAKFKINSKNILRFSSNVNLKSLFHTEEKEKISESFESKIVSANTVLSLVNNTKEYTTSQQGLWIHRYEKTAKLTSLYFSHFSNYYTPSKVYENTIQNGFINFINNQKIRKEYIEHFYNFQIVQTFPMSRKWLFETKLDLSNERTPFKQDGFQYNGDTSYFRKDLSALYESNDKNGYFLGTFFYKSNKISIMPGFGIWRGYTKRVWDDSSFIFKRQSLYPRFSIKYQLSKMSRLSIRINETQQMPSLSQLAVIPDSSNLQYIQAGNFTLKNFSRKQFEADLATSFKNGLNTSFSLQFQYDKNSIISNSVFNEFGGISQNLIQISDSKRLTSTFFLFKLNRNKSYSFFCASFVNWSQSYLAWNNKIEPFENLYIYITENFKWRISELNTLSLELKNTLLSQKQQYKAKSSNFRSDFFLLLESELKKNIFVELKLNYAVVQNISKENTTYPFFDFSLNKYTKNQKVRFFITLKNVFNVNSNFVFSQMLNGESEKRMNTLPRYFMAGATFYVEKWK